jgi:hypothetical protein
VRLWIVVACLPAALWPRALSAEPEKPDRLSPAARAILAGAREEAKRKTRYDISMGYYVTRFKNGKDTRRAVFPGGDIDPAIGVCTDLVVRALRRAGYDLQALIQADRRRRPRGYVGRRANRNIDHRRVPNLLLYFKRHGKRLTTRADAKSCPRWLGGDIVFWNLDGRGRIDHVGIVSDRRDPKTGRPWVIHAYPSPGYTAELDVLESWPIVGHFRFPKDGKVRSQ